MIFAIKLKKCVANIDIFGIIISKLCYKKKSCLIILFKVDKNSKISFNCGVLSLSLAICLRIEGG